MSGAESSARAARRQVLATMLLPGLLLAAIYMVSLRLELAREISAREEQVVAAEAKLPDAATLSRQAQELDDLRAQVEAVRARQPLASETASSLPNPAQRAQRRLIIGAILAHNHLLLVQEEHSTLQVGVQVAPQIMPSAASTTPSKPGAAAPPRSQTKTSTRARVPVATLTLQGSYLEMLSALEDLRDAEIGVIPLQVEMRRTDSLAGDPDGMFGIEWTLVLT